MDRLTKWLGRDDAPDAPGAVQQHASEVAPLPALSEPLAEVAASADVPRMPDHVVQQATVPPAPATPAPDDRVPYFERERVLTPAVYTAEVSAQDAAAAPVVSPQPPAPARSRFAHLVPDTAPIVATPAPVPAPVPVAVVETATVPAPPVVETEAAPATTTPATASDLTVAPPVMDVPAAVETAPEPGKIRTLADMAQGQELLPPYTKAERPAIPDRMPFAQTIQAVETPAPAPAAPPAAAAAPVPVPAMAAPAPAPAVAAPAPPMPAPAPAVAAPAPPMPAPAPAMAAPAPQSSDSFVYIPGQPTGQPVSNIPAPPPPASAGPAPVAPAPSRPKLSDKMRTPPAPAAPPAPVARAQKKSRRRFF